MQGIVNIAALLDSPFHLKNSTSSLFIPLRSIICYNHEIKLAYEVHTSLLGRRVGQAQLFRFQILEFTFLLNMGMLKGAKNDLPRPNFLKCNWAWSLKIPIVS